MIILLGVGALTLHRYDVQRVLIWITFGRFVLGDLAARVDWGYAPDYVDAMIRILALDVANDFVIAQIALFVQGLPLLLAFIVLAASTGSAKSCANAEIRRRREND